MIFKIKKPQSGLRVRTLALLLQLIAVFLISLTFMITTNNNLMQVQTIFNISSTLIFEAETSRQLEYSLQLYQVSITQAIALSNHTLISMQELYTVIQNESQYIHTQTYPEYSINDQYNWYNGQQFGFKSTLPLDQLEYSSLLNFTRLLNEYVAGFQFFEDNTTIVAYIDYGPEEFYLQYPVLLRGAEQLQTNQQLSNFKQSNLGNQLTTPIFEFANGPIYLTTFNQLTDSNLVKGALRYDQIFALVNFPQIYSIIADQNGNINSYYGVLNYTSQEPLFPSPNYPEFNLTASSVTGFSQEDWFKIMKSEQSFVYNTFLEVNVYAKRQKFRNSEYLLIVYQDVSSYLTQQQQIMMQLETFSTDILQKFYITLIFFISVGGLFQLVFIVKILKPFSTLTLLVQYQIYSITKNDIRTSFLQQLQFHTLKANYSMIQLYSAIIEQKNRSLMQKSSLCSVFQQFIYPRANNEQIIATYTDLPQDYSLSTETIQRLFENTNF